MGGLARRASYVQSVRKRNANVLLLDAGHLVGGDGSDAAIRLKAQTTLAAMNLMGYDALNLGTDELTLGRSFLERQQGEVSFPFLAANLADPVSGERSFATYTIKETGHLQVGIIGLVSPTFYRGDDLIAFDPASALRAVLPEVTQQAHLVVVLAQMHFDEAVELAQDVPGVQVIIVADGAGTAGEPVRVNEALLVRCDHWGMSIGELHIVGNTEGQVVNYQWRKSVLDKRVTDDPSVVELLQRHMTGLDP